jgi:hypothetical protein
MPAKNTKIHNSKSAQTTFCLCDTVFMGNITAVFSKNVYVPQLEETVVFKQGITRFPF